MSSANAYLNRQFATWMLVFVPLFVIAGITITELSPPQLFTFTAGVVFAIVLDPVNEYLIDKWEASQEDEA